MWCACAPVGIEPSYPSASLATEGRSALAPCFRGISDSVHEYTYFYRVATCFTYCSALPLYLTSTPAAYTLAVLLNYLRSTVEVPLFILEVPFCTVTVPDVTVLYRYLCPLFLMHTVNTRLTLLCLFH